MSRTGKIARLPQPIREQLNFRLHDGHSGREIIDWVNSLPECRQMLDEKFGGRPIDDGNLHEWRYGGYEEWLWNESRRARLQFLFERTAKLDAVGDGHQLSENLGNVIAVELAEELEMIEGIRDPKERWRHLREICRELSRLRRENCNGQRLRLAEQQWEHLREKDQRDQANKTPNNSRIEPLNPGSEAAATLNAETTSHAPIGWERSGFRSRIDWLWRFHNGSLTSDSSNKHAAKTLGNP